MTNLNISNPDEIPDLPVGAKSVFCDDPNDPKVDMRVTGDEITALAEMGYGARRHLAEQVMAVIQSRLDRLEERAAEIRCRCDETIRIDGKMLAYRSVLMMMQRVASSETASLPKVDPE